MKAKKKREADYRYLKRALKAGRHIATYETRSYQLRAAHLAAAAIAKKKHAVLTLPTGTGKTLICGMAAAIFLRDNPEARVIVSAPRLALLEQISDRTKWLNPTHGSRAIGLDARESSAHVRSTFHNYRVIFGMPDFLSRRISSASIPRREINSVKLLIVDEFDAFLTTRYLSTYATVSFHQSFQKLIDMLPSDCRLLLISATTPEMPAHDVADDPEDEIDRQSQAAFRKFLDEKYDPEYIDISERYYRNYIPHAQIKAGPVFDKSVIEYDRAISSEFGLLVNWISGEAGYHIDASYVLPRVELILSGRMKGFPNSDSPIVRSLLAKLKQVSHLPDFLFEDMFVGFGWSYEPVSKWDSELTRRFYTEEIRLNMPEKGADGQMRFYPEIGRKFESIVHILAGHRNEKGVIFFRYIRLLREVSNRLKELGWEVIPVHGELEPKQNTANLNRFRRESKVLLAITRDTGKRGLDLPEADFAIFYSPKAREDVTWQEVSRIRSTIMNKKSTYLLYYSSTGEVRKAARMLEALQKTTHSSSIDLVPLP